MWCILLKNLTGWWCPWWWARGGDCGFCFFLRLSWKNCCIISEHSVDSTPRLMVIFGWKGWIGPVPWLWFAESRVLVCPSPGKSLKNKCQSSSFLFFEFSILTLINGNCRFNKSKWNMKKKIYILIGNNLVSLLECKATGLMSRDSSKCEKHNINNFGLNMGHIILMNS